jgi:hypothetical protein
MSKATEYLTKLREDCLKNFRERILEGNSEGALIVAKTVHEIDEVLKDDRKQGFVPAATMKWPDAPLESTDENASLAAKDLQSIANAMGEYDIGPWSRVEDYAIQLDALAKDYRRIVDQRVPTKESARPWSHMSIHEISAMKTARGLVEQARIRDAGETLRLIDGIIARIGSQGWLTADEATVLLAAKYPKDAEGARCLSVVDGIIKRLQPPRIDLPSCTEPDPTIRRIVEERDRQWKASARSIGLEVAGG